MARTRKLSTLYKLLSNNNGGFNGICIQMAYLSDRGLITQKEYDLLQGHFRNKRPTPSQYPEFHEPCRFLEAYWWPRENYQVRERFIEVLRKECRKQKI